jgi:hypothetical protein
MKKWTESKRLETGKGCWFASWIDFTSMDGPGGVKIVSDNRSFIPFATNMVRQ